MNRNLNLLRLQISSRLYPMDDKDLHTLKPDPDQSHLSRPPIFGKYQQTFTLFVMIVFFQLPLILSGFMLIYSVIFLDYHIWAIFTCITIVQYPFGKSRRVIDLMNKYINPLLYFKSFKRIFEQPIPDDKRKCLFAFHPHSVFAYGTFLYNKGLLANMNYNNHDALSNMVGVGSRFILNMPITGLLLRLWGVQAVDPSNIKKLMSNGQNVGLLPGGFQQATLTTQKQMRIFIQNRKGFIKYALKHNYTIYPTIILKQHQAFWTWDKFLKLRMYLNKIKMPAVLFFNPKSFLFYPPNLEIVTVIGKGLQGKEYSADQEPSIDEIDQMHKLYIKQIKRIYDKHKNLNGNKPLVMY